MSNTLVKRETGEVIIMEPPLSAKEVKAQVDLIQQVMDMVMVDGEHYGVVPGCGKKKVLLKAGAEKLASTFRLVINPIIEEKNDGDSITFTTRCEITGPNGNFLGAGVGIASTKEEKFNWRKAVNEAEFNATPEDRRRLKYASSNGKDYTTLQIRTNPYDVANTVLKISKKRGMVDAVLSVTAASDIFTQDLEEHTDGATTNNQAQNNGPSEKQIAWLMQTCKNHDISENELKDIVSTKFKKTSRKQLTYDEIGTLCNEIIPQAGKDKKERIAKAAEATKDVPLT